MLKKQLVDIPQTGLNLYVLPLSDHLYSILFDFFQVSNLDFSILSAVSRLLLKLVYLLVVEITQQRSLDR